MRWESAQADPYSQLRQGSTLPSKWSRLSPPGRGGERMRSIKSCGMPLASTAAACLAMLLATQVLFAQETKEKVTVDDVDRTFMVRLPRGYDAQQHYPVVILLHGMNQDADDMERLTQFDQLADKDGIIVVYPMALHGRWNVGVRPQEHRSAGMGPGGRRRGGGYPGGGYPGGGDAGGG